MFAEIVRPFSEKIKNGRTLRDITDHMVSEVNELYEEIDKIDAGEEPGKDGVVGEAIDVIACALDAIFVHSPNIDIKTLEDILQSKCEKWARRYAENVHGDRTID